MDVSDAIRGAGPSKREFIVEHAGRLVLRWKNWKFIPAGKGVAFQPLTGTETGNLDADQLYDLDVDPHEDRNIADVNPTVVTRMKEMLARIRAGI
jgi:hypothetical protein